MRLAEERAGAVWRGLIRARAKVARALRQALQEEGLSWPQFGVLRVVGEAGPEGIKLNEIGERLYVTCGNVTGLVDRLESMGYVVRAAHPDDRRALLARLTPQGWEAYERLVPPHRARVTQVMSCLSAQEQEQLAQLLERVAEQAERLAETCGGTASARR